MKMNTFTFYLLTGICYSSMLNCTFASEGITDDFKNFAEHQSKAEQGDVKSQLILGTTYYKMRDFKKAAHWFSLAANADNAEGQACLAVLYEHGLGVHKDLLRAIELYEKAAEKNAQQFQPIVQKYEKIIKLRDSAMNGDPQSIYNIGEMYRIGHILENDYEKAAEYYSALAEVGYDEGYIRLLEISDIRKAITNAEDISEIEPVELNKLTKEKAAQLTVIDGKLTIPEEYQVIAANAFSERSDIESVIIPDSVQVICQNAFFKCSELQHVSVHDNIKYIGNNAFNSCTNLRTVNLGLSKKLADWSVDSDSEAEELDEFSDFDIKIGNYAFANCTNLRSVEMGDIIKQIGVGAFKDCSNLHYIHFSDFITNILEDTFVNCSNLKSIVLPYTLEYIEDNAFSGCDNLNSVTYFDGDDFDPSYCFALSNAKLHCLTEHGFYTALTRDKAENKRINSYGTIDIYDNYIDADAFRGRTDIEEIYLENTRHIGYGAFRQCKNLKRVFLTNVEKIEANAFSDCPNLEKVVIQYDNHDGDIISTIEPGTFKGCKKLSRIEIDGEISDIGSYAFADCSELTNFNTVFAKNIERHAFENCSKLYNMGWGNELEYIGAHAFSKCSMLNSFIGVNIKHLGRKAFYKCLGIREVNISNKLEKINRSTFEGCNLLRFLELPASVKSIEKHAFKNCANLNYVHLPESIENIDKDAFADSNKVEFCTSADNMNNLEKFGISPEKIHRSLTKAEAQNIEITDGTITIPDDVVHIMNGAFRDISGFSKVILPESVLSIGRSSFFSTDIESIVMPGVKSIGMQAFCGCKSLKVINASNHLREIRCEAFKDCIALTNFAIPDSVRYIGYCAFKNCTNLQTVQLPKHLKVLANCAFVLCNSLEFLHIPGSIEVLGNMICFGCDKLEGIYVPESLQHISVDAFLVRNYDYRKNIIRCHIYSSNKLLSENEHFYGLSDSEFSSSLYDPSKMPKKYQKNSKN